MENLIGLAVSVIAAESNVFHNAEGIVKSIHEDKVFVELNKEFDEICELLFYGKRTFMFHITKIMEL